MKASRFMCAAAAMVFAASLWSCGGGGSSSTADTGVTQAQFNALQAQVNTLQTTVTALQAQVPHNLITTTTPLSSVVTSSLRTYAMSPATAAPNATTVGTFTATFLGPVSGSVIGMTQEVGISSSNYIFIAQAAAGTNSAQLAVTIFYEGVNCTGNAFAIPASGISQANASQGMVFGIGAVGDNTASDYLMLVAGEAMQPDTAYSELQALPTGPSCVNITPTPNSYASTWPLKLNDPNVSKVVSGAFTTSGLN